MLVQATRTERRPLSSIKVNPQVRKQFSPEGMARLVESIKSVGVLEPPVILPDGTLIVGERRVRAMIQAGLETGEFKVIDAALSESQIRILQLTENMQREDLTGYEQWRGSEELLMLNPDWANKDLAEHLQLSPSYITQLLSPSRCIVEAQEALEVEKIGIGDCYVLSQHPAEEQAVLLGLKLSGATRDELERRGKKARNGRSEAPKVSRVKCVLRGGVVTFAAEGGLTLDDLVELGTELLKEARKANDQGLSAKTFEKALRDRAGGANGK